VAVKTIVVVELQHKSEDAATILSWRWSIIFGVVLLFGRSDCS
jgi:hypothetical protein